MEPKPSGGAVLLEVENVDVCLRGDPRHVRVSALDWRIEAGAYWVVGGPPESGKTDLLATTAGLQRACRGSVRLLGSDLSHLPEPELLKQRARIGYVFKGGGRVFADMTVAENIALPLQYHRNLGAEEALDTVHELLSLTELGNIGPERPQQLGISIQQRVGLARALALQPEILFLDEPLAGLGWRHRQWWLEFLEKLTAGIPFMNGKKVAVVATTNDFAPWSGRRVCYGLIREGRWQALGEQAQPPNV